ncbi:hypothetical protein AAG570_009999 [Ranatra chinensis]|uniref:Uncharacterized protein n=1 Tax=Ranatra chinensis TaxID=642074 RepID=A0ABD0YQV6_9HEMI
MEEGECASPLSSLFKVGQVLCCKVTVHKVLTVGKGTLKEALEVSTDPKDVNADLTVESVNVGDLIQMAVESREDHGYQMYSGVPGIRAFLPAKQVQRYQSEFISSKPLGEFGESIN